jgi:hypothetical protein
MRFNNALEMPSSLGGASERAPKPMLIALFQAYDSIKTPHISANSPP